MYAFINNTPLQIDYLTSSNAHVSRGGNSPETKATLTKGLVSRIEAPVMNLSEDNYNDLEFAISWNRFTLRLIGIWPDPETNYPEKLEGPLKYKFLLPAFVIFSFISIPQTISLIHVWGDLDLVVENFILANIPIGTALIKFLIFVYHRKGLELLVAHLIEDWRNRKNEQERSTMLRSAKIARRISISCICSGYFTAIALFSAYFITQLQERLAIRNGTEPIRALLYQSYFLFDVYTSPGYEVAVMGQLAATLIGITAYSGISSFISMVVLHLCGQFENLRGTLKSTVANATCNEAEWRFRKELAAVVTRHLHLNKCAESLEDSFNLILLVELLGCSVQFCFQGFQVISMLSNDEGLSTMQMIFFSLFIVTLSLDLYIYCYVSESLYVESMAMGDAFYESQWYDLKLGRTRDLILIMCESRKPLKITAGKFFSLSIKQFSDVVKTSMGYLSVLLALKN